MLSSRYTRTVVLLPVVLLATLAACYPMLFNGWVNWDDPAYVLNNALLRDSSLSGIGALFSTLQVQGMYHPFTLISLAFDYWCVGDSAWFYHAHNLVLHCINTVLVYQFIRLLIKRNLVAGITALLFGIHPMHVESVAWVSERKDVLYACYFLLALIAWVRYTDSTRHKKGWYVATLGFFVLSLLAKSMAVTLPIVLLLVDYLRNRTSWRIQLLEKVPFLLLSIGTGLVAISAQQAGTAMGSVADLQWHKTLFVGAYGLVVYCRNALLPINLAAFHPYPNLPDGAFPWYIYASAIPVLVAVGLLWWKARKQRTTVFGVLFFAVCVGPVLQILSVGKAIVSERFTYIPYIGLFLLLTMGWHWFVSNPKRPKLQRNIATALLVVFLGLLGWRTNIQSRVWENNFTLWKDVIELYPNNHLAYCNRATTYAQSGQLELALKDCNSCIERDQSLYESFNNRGMVHRGLGNMQLAYEDFSQALSLNPNYLKALNNRAGLLLNINRLPQAQEDLDRVLKRNPQDLTALYNRAVVHFRLKEQPAALNAINLAIELMPQEAAYYELRAAIYVDLGEHKLARADDEQGRALGL